MASKFELYDTGYDDERFEQIVRQTLHCIICTNVIKDAVTCHHNEHLFCRACITEHLKNYKTCPSCMDALTVDTLSQAPRSVRNLLAELKIRCEFFDRGCVNLIKLGSLGSHLRECGFAPAVCSNEGCQLEVNKQDLLHHETAVCEQRRVKCHSCTEIRQEMDIMKVNLAAINENLETNIKAVEENLVTKVKLVQEQLNKQEESTRRLEADNAEMKKSLNEMTKQLEKMTQLTLHEVQTEQEHMKRGIAKAVEMNRELKVIIAGGENDDAEDLNSVEMFSLSNGTWTRLRPMRERRSGASSVMYNNQFIVMGGWVKSMEKFSLNAVQAEQSITWENVAAELAGEIAGHGSVVYNGRLIVIGGYDLDEDACSDSITEISLVPPYTSKVLTTMRQRKCYHGVVLFGNVIVIVGGSEKDKAKSALRSVVMYDITTNEFEVLASLSYPVFQMATVKWGDDNLIIMGGADSDSRSLNTVLIYNVKTRKCHMLPEMKYKRRGCVAAAVRDNVIVMGGADERGNILKSVECFRFDRYTWEELPEMHVSRCWATAAAVLITFSLR